MANNTGLEADSDHQLGDITCHSSSRQPHIGRWITPNGDDITLTGNDIFSVEFRSGHFPSYIVLSLKQGIYVATQSTHTLLTCVCYNVCSIEWCPDRMVS